MQSSSGPQRTTLVACAAILVLASLSLNSCYSRFKPGQDDFFENYDNKAKDARFHTRDWPVTLFFYGPGANVAHIADILDGLGFPSTGGIKNMFLHDAHDGDGTGAHWDTNRGKKNPNTFYCDLGLGNTDIHVRLYADTTDDRMTNTDWGNYVVGTTHWDIRENCNDESFGNSENAEQLFAEYFIAAGYSVSIDTLFVDNHEDTRTEGNNLWSNDGFATRIYIPA